MRVVKVAPTIKYYQMSDAEGDFGLLVETKRGLLAEIHSREEFIEVYNQFTQS